MSSQFCSLSCQIILRGTRSAGYGFVAVATEEACAKAVVELNGKELEGRKAVVEQAKPADQKAKERNEKKAKRRANRRGTKAVPGEVTEAEANGEAEKPAATDAENAEQKPKKKKKKSAVCFIMLDDFVVAVIDCLDVAQAQEGQGCRKC